MERTESSTKVSGSRMVALRSSSGAMFYATRGAMRLSKTINDMITNLGIDFNDQSQREIGPIPLSDVDSYTLSKIIQWCEHHRDDADNAREKGSYDELNEWDKRLLEIDNEQLMRLVNSANFMDVDILLDVLAKKVASMIRGKKVEEVRMMFGIANDFSPEEEEEGEKKNKNEFAIRRLDIIR
ncbi:unnamed protein product [Toxocara canis]|uniref:Skp1-related protein n=1 Tax=Toxocara canis TaxID=6265 RepID=A0A183UTD6_TOXCA|nr:unnamed protein product [Toxocara canis]